MEEEQGSTERGVHLSDSCQIFECLAKAKTGWGGQHWPIEEWGRWLLLGQGQAMFVQLWVQVSQEDAGLHGHLLLLRVHL